MPPRAAALIRAVQIYTDVSLSEGQALAVLQQVDAVAQADYDARIRLIMAHEEAIAASTEPYERVEARWQSYQDRVTAAFRRAREP